MDLINPQQLTFTCADGKEHTFFISKFPAVQGREIIAKYPISAMPKIGDYNVSEETMLKLMAFVEVQSGEKRIRLATAELVNNHVPSWEDLAKIEIAMMQYNCSFFTNGTSLIFLDGLVQKVLGKISEILTSSSASSSEKNSQASTNSEPSTH